MQTEYTALQGLRTKKEFEQTKIFKLSKYIYN